MNNWEESSLLRVPKEALKQKPMSFWVAKEKWEKISEEERV